MIAIDPGKNGGISWVDEDGIVQAVPMPDGMTEQCDLLRTLSVGHGGKVILEKVGTYRPGNSGPAAATFARHVGHLEAALYMLGMPVIQVAPTVWTKWGGWSVTKHLPMGYATMEKKAKERARSKAERDHKNEVKETMARRYPHLDVTLKTADAIAMLAWGMEGKR